MFASHDIWSVPGEASQLKSWKTPESVHFNQREGSHGYAEENAMNNKLNMPFSCVNLGTNDHNSMKMTGSAEFEHSLEFSKEANNYEDLEQIGNGEFSQ